MNKANLLERFLLVGYATIMFGFMLVSGSLAYYCFLSPEFILGAFGMVFVGTCIVCACMVFKSIMRARELSLRVTPPGTGRFC